VNVLSVQGGIRDCGLTAHVYGGGGAPSSTATTPYTLTDIPTWRHPVPQGTVRWFDPERGFGFLAPEDGGADLFVHASEIAGDGGARLLREGQAVEFEVGDGERGPQARRVRVTGDVSESARVGVLGSIAWYEPGKGYGFATPDGGGPEVFVHSSAIVTGCVVTAGQRVAFLVGEGERGPQAENLIPLGEAAGAPAATDGADGTVSWYDEDKGFGFVTPDGGGDDVFVHVRALTEGLTWLTEGDRVAYEVVQSDKGPQARSLHLVQGAAAEDASAAAPAAASSVTPARAGEGVVARYDAERGFGFITPDAGGADLFVHTSVLNGAEPLQKGERVRYKVRQSDRGPQADRVERI
jgi:CspA family cold shock protein